MLLIAASGIDGIFSVAIVRIAAALTASASGPVLRHCVDAARAPAVAIGRLKPVGVGASESSHKVWVAAESAAVAIPARVGAQIGLRRQCRGYTQQPVFPCRRAGKRLNHLGAERGCKPEHIAPKRYFSATAGCKLGVGSGIVAWVRRIIGRNAMTAPLTQSLHTVVPPCRRSRAFHLAHKHMAHIVGSEELQLRVTQVPRFHAALGKGASAVGVTRHGKPVLGAI